MIVIIGGGITALSAAMQLQKRGIEFILLEQSEQCGGKIQSLQIDDFQIELGPNTVLINNPETKALIEDLKLWDRLIFANEGAVKNRYVLKNGKPEQIPNSIGSLWNSDLFKFSTFRSLLSEPFVKKREQSEDESLADFTKRRLGDQLLNDFVTPFISGIYAGDPEKMSISYTLSILKEAEDEYGSIFKGMPKIMKKRKLERADWDLPKNKIFSFENGLSDLIKALEDNLKGKIQYHSAVRKIEREGHEYQVHYEQNGEQKMIKAAKLVSCIPATNLSEVIAFDQEFTEAIQKINYVPAVVTHLGFDNSQWKGMKNAFGLLSRKAEKVPFLGVLFNSNFFPHQSNENELLITVISGGYRNPELIHMQEEEIVKEIMESLTKLGFVEGEPKMQHVFKWKAAIPQYELGYREIEKEIQRFQAENEGFHIGGNYYNGVSVSDCIANGAKLADQISE